MGKLVSLNFRTWLQEMWYKHREELESYGQRLPYTSAEYFSKYKYWLKREYRHYTRNTNV